MSNGAPALFYLLVMAQDYAMSVAEARQMASDLFGLAATQVVQIEQEGLENTWPIRVKLTD